MPTVTQILTEASSHHRDALSHWLEAENQRIRPFFYSSVDVRHSGFKIAPVDTNLYPAGFNNLSEGARNRATQQVKVYLAHYFPETQRILIFPEKHTRNLYYLDNLLALQTMITDAGVEVRIGNADPEQPGTQTLTTQSGKTVILDALHKDGVMLETKAGFQPDVIVVNNDLSSGISSWLQGVTQPMIPPLMLGWYQRRKWVHFSAYADVAAECARLLEVDPWRMSAYFRHCGRINFHEKKGLECVASNVERVLDATRAKYQEYGISDTPYAYIKADSGTYGMGIMTVRSGDEVLEINKKGRAKMNIIKEGVSNSEVLIQEGVLTVDRLDGHTAEAMVYLMGGCPIGGAWRIHESRDAHESLNTPGMMFSPFRDEACDSFSAFCLIARLAAMAATREVYEMYEI